MNSWLKSLITPIYFFWLILTRSNQFWELYCLLHRLSWLSTGRVELGQGNPNSMMARACRMTFSNRPTSVFNTLWNSSKTGREAVELLAVILWTKASILRNSSWLSSVDFFAHYLKRISLVLLCATYESRGACASASLVMWSLESGWS